MSVHAKNLLTIIQHDINFNQKVNRLKFPQDLYSFGHFGGRLTLTLTK